MGLSVEEIRTSLPNRSERVTLDEMDKPLRVYDDAVGFLLERPGGNRILPGETFSLRIPFSHDHPMFTGKTLEQQRELMQAIAGNEDGGDFSLRSKYAIAGMTRTETIPTFSRTEQGAWEMVMELANDGPRAMVVPNEIAIGRPFERPKSSLTGEELVHVAAGFCPGETDHIRFLTRGDKVIGFQELLLHRNTAFDSDDELYPVAVVLPYTEEIGIIKTDGSIDLATMKSRRKGWVEENVDFISSNGTRRSDNHSVELKETSGVMIVPEGMALVIRQKGLPGEVGHGPSVVALGAKILEETGEIENYNWQIIGEHPFRTAGNDVRNPTGFISDVYRVS